VAGTVGVDEIIGVGMFAGLGVGVKVEFTVTEEEVDWVEVAPELSVTVAVIEKKPAEAGEKLNVDAVWPLWADPFTYHW
jgi:hypothetical protein